MLNHLLCASVAPLDSMGEEARATVVVPAESALPRHLLPLQMPLDSMGEEEARAAVAALAGRVAPLLGDAAGGPPTKRPAVAAA